MRGVSSIEWTLHTSDDVDGGTNSRVTVLILNDWYPILSAKVERGNTSRLDRGEILTTGWEFKHPQGFPSSEHGIDVPYTKKFPLGIRGHMRVYFTIHGNDAWEVGLITSRVTGGQLEDEPLSRNGKAWVAEVEEFRFEGNDILSTDRTEGITTLGLNY